MKYNVHQEAQRVAGVARMGIHGDAVIETFWRMTDLTEDDFSRDELVEGNCPTHGAYITQAERDGLLDRWECPAAGCNSTDEIEHDQDPA